MNQTQKFNKLTEEIKKTFETEWHKSEDNLEAIIKLQKDAILGKEEAVLDLMEKIHNYLVENDCVESFVVKNN